MVEHQVPRYTATPSCELRWIGWHTVAVHYPQTDFLKQIFGIVWVAN
jgi:hypothetical protein